MKTNIFLFLKIACNILYYIQDITELGCIFEKFGREKLNNLFIASLRNLEIWKMKLYR